MSKPCTDKAVDKLVEVFKELGTNVIDEVIGKAKSKFSLIAKEDEKKAKKDDLEKLFESQLKTLLDRGCPEAIVEIFKNQRDDVLAKASEMTFAEGHIPFLPVIPRIYRTIYDQMPMVRNGGKIGYTYFDPNEIIDVVEYSNKPYYIFDVENGNVMLGESPEKAEKLIKGEGRRCLTEVEVISLGVHTDVLSHHYVDATGSRSESGDKVPGLYLFDRRPKLFYFYASFPNEKWGSASCGS